MPGTFADHVGRGSAQKPQLPDDQLNLKSLFVEVRKNRRKLLKRTIVKALENARTAVPMLTLMRDSLDGKPQGQEDKGAKVIVQVGISVAGGAPQVLIPAATVLAVPPDSSMIRGESESDAPKP